MRKKLFTFLLALAAGVGAIFASTTQVDGIWYDFNNSDLTATVTYRGSMSSSYDNEYSGAVVIPASVNYNGKTYSVTSIGETAFQVCHNLTSVTIPNSVTSIGDYAFGGCSSLTSVTIPNSVTSLGQGAFINCRSLTSVTISNNITNIGDYAFGDCTSLISIEIPNSIISIGNDTFHGCSGLISVTIPNSVISIGDYAFFRCSSLTSINIPSSVISIGRYAFSGCSGLTSMTIPNSVTSIGDGAFSSCTGLTSVTIGNSVTSIGSEAFKNCSGLTSIQWNAVHCADFTSTSTPFYNIRSQITSFTFGDEVEYIPAYLCAGMKNAKITITNCKTEIGAYALDDCNYLKEGTHTTYLPDTTVCYGGWVFDGEPLLLYNYLDSDDAPCNWNKDEWMRLGYDPFPKNEYGEYDDTLFELFMSWFYEHIHYDATTLPTGVTTYQTNITNGQQFYTSGVYTRTFINSTGCDSIVSRNVIVNKAVAPKIIVTPEQDTFNSGTIRIYNKYCTGSEYYEGQYKYYYNNAEYDYFTINDTKYEFSSAIEGEYNEYYHPDGIRVIDEPSTVINNLHGGNYHIVFYSACDSVVEDVTIEGYGIKINGIYYTYFSDGVGVSYRGSYDGEYEEYFGNIIIPDSVTFNGNTLPVIYVDPYAFAFCPQLTSITFKSKVPPYCTNCLFTQLNNLTIYVPFGSMEAYRAAYGCCWKWMGSSGYSSSFNTTIHVINPSHVMATTEATSATITLGEGAEVAHIASCGIAEVESTVGNVLEYIGLEPNSTYSDIPLFVKTIEGDSDVLTVTFSTTALELTTKPSKTVSATTAILLAETNMSDAEVSCGFEYKRNDAPDDMAGTKVFCPVASGQMAGRLKGLKDDVYYKYRAFYQSKAGNMYYGDWQYIFTGDNAVEFDPILYTYTASVVTETGATLSGYALAGSEDFTEQGFEYWAESRANNGANAPRRMTAALNEHFFAQANGIKMTVTLTNLDEGTVYKYRAYGKVGNQYYYGSEQTFTTQGEWQEGQGQGQGIEEVPSDQVQNTKAQKILRNGQIYILYKDQMYNVQGQKVK